MGMSGIIEAGVVAAASGALRPAAATADAGTAEEAAGDALAGLFVERDHRLDQAVVDRAERREQFVKPRRPVRRASLDMNRVAVDREGHSDL